MSSNEGRFQPVRWGVLGTANIARARVVPGMVASPAAEVVAVASRSLEKAQSFADEFDVERRYDTYEALLSDSDIEAVYIPLPNHMHVDYARAALDAGKHVLCEKPVALNAAEAQRLADIPEGLLFGEAFMVRHNPQWKKTRELLRSGEYGKAMAVQIILGFHLEAPADFRFRPEYGGGALYDLGCYAIMSSRYIFESEPIRVFASMDTDPSTGTDRLVTAILDFGDGRYSTFTSWLHVAAMQRVQIVCERGSIDLPAPYVPTETSPAELYADSHNSFDDIDRRRIEVSQVDQYTQEITDFSRAIRGEFRYEFGLDDAIAQMKTMDAIFTSAGSGQWEAVAP